MTDLREALDSWTGRVAEISDPELSELLHILERAYIHALIEAQLRGGSRQETPRGRLPSGDAAITADAPGPGRRRLQGR